MAKVEDDERAAAVRTDAVERRIPFSPWERRRVDRDSNNIDRAIAAVDGEEEGERIIVVMIAIIIIMMMIDLDLLFCLFVCLLPCLLPCLLLVVGRCRLFLVVKQASGCVKQAWLSDC